MPKHNIILKHLDKEFDKYVHVFGFQLHNPTHFDQITKSGITLRPFEAALLCLKNMQECIDTTKTIPEFCLNDDEDCTSLRIKLTNRDLFHRDNNEARRQLVDCLTEGPGVMCKFGDDKVIWNTKPIKMYSIEYWDKKHSKENIKETKK